MTTSIRRTLLTMLTLVVASGSPVRAEETSGKPLSTQLRRPVDCAWDEATGRIWIANRGSGTLTMFDPEELRIAAEFALGQSLIDLAPVLDRRQTWLALDAAAGELLLFETTSGVPKVISRVAVPSHARRLAVSPYGERIYVTSLWPKRLAVFVLDREPQPAENKVGESARLRAVEDVDLPFFADQLLLLPQDDKLIVADAFRGRLAIVDTTTHAVEAVREFPGHNIRSLSLTRDGKRLYVVQQHLNAKALADFDDVTWGILLFNGIRSLDLERVLDPDADLLDDNRGIALGMTEDHAGDPGRLIQTSDGQLAAMLTGSGTVAVGTDRFDFKLVEVGRRPVAAVFSPNGQRLFVVNEFSDSVSVVDTEQAVLLREVSLGPRPELTPVQRGEQLFLDARLSLDRWMSCNTCHSEGHTVDELVDTLGDGDYGAPKRIPSLLGVGDTAPLAWNGGLPALDDQIRKSVSSTMHGTPLSDAQVADLAAYLRTLKRPQPVEETAPPEALVEAGRAVFESHRCSRCHIPPAYTSPRVYDVGLTDEQGRSEFNPPSLRGVSLRHRWLHDGRATQLQDVWEQHGHYLQSPLTPDESAALLAFLQSL